LDSGTTQIFKKILCPVDFDHSLGALDFAIRLANQNQAALCVLHVAVIPIGAAELTNPIDTEPFWEATARSRLEQLAKNKLEGKANYELMTASGDAALGIIQAQVNSGADLIVMATHGRSGIRHFFLGSVAEQVVREAGCPVLTIRPA
jgi:universal stress protein A